MLWQLTVALVHCGLRSWYAVRPSSGWLYSPNVTLVETPVADRVGVVVELS